MNSDEVRVVPTEMPPGDRFWSLSKSMSAVSGPARPPTSEKYHAGPSTSIGGGSCVPPVGAGAAAVDGGGKVAPPPPPGTPLAAELDARGVRRLCWSPQPAAAHKTNAANNLDGWGT